jgi:PAS domain S-box-containing protein
LPIAAINPHEEIKLIYSNGLAEELLGYNNNELFQLSKDNFKKIIHPNDYEKFKNGTSKILSSKEGEIITFDFRIKKADGGYLMWLARDIVFEWSDDGKALKYASVIQDITEVVNLESNIAELVRKLDLISFKNSHNLRGPVASLLGLMEVMKMEDFHSVYNQKIFKHLETTVIKLDNVISEITNITDH